MSNYKKTLIGSIVTFIIGTSCCWLSSLAIWFGGAAVIGTFVSFIESTQTVLILVSALLAGISIFLYLKNRSEKANGN